jgi:hypothetical protein
MPYVKDWMRTYSKLTDQEKTELLEILANNNPSDIQNGLKNTKSKRITKLLEFHLYANQIVKKFKNE